MSAASSLPVAAPDPDFFATWLEDGSVSVGSLAKGFQTFRLLEFGVDALESLVEERGSGASQWTVSKVIPFPGRDRQVTVIARSKPDDTPDTI